MSHRCILHVCFKCIENQLNRTEPNRNNYINKNNNNRRVDAVCDRASWVYVVKL